MAKIQIPTCSECGQVHCQSHDSRFPDFCLSESVDAYRIDDSLALYRGPGSDADIARAAAEIEGAYYGKLTRVEETVAFARRIKARRIGIATCVGLLEETRVFAKILRMADMDPFTVACKVGSTDKTGLGLAETAKLRPNSFEAACNPILQAELLNEHNTDLNIVIGLCVGHDTLFIRHSEAPVTVMIVKDRVLAHNPAAAIYGAKSYFSRILDKVRIRAL
jgi:uncharacterized metal-binding protein